MSVPAVLFGALALGLLASAFLTGGLMVILLPVALAALLVAAGLQLNQRRRAARQMEEYRDQAKAQSVEFTARDKQTLYRD
jgi:hypothetical protein